MSFKQELKTTEAAYPRHAGGTILVGDRLKIAYHKYTNTDAIPQDQLALNLVFVHGAGMNKSIWKYHVQKLYDIAAKSDKWKLATVIALDAVNHGDSAMVNRDKLGWGHLWQDLGRDIVEVVKSEQKLNPGTMENVINSRNILIGHSFGGFGAAYAGSSEPLLFDSLVLIEPVAFFNNDPVLRDKYTAIFQKVASMLMDTFDSREDFETFFKEFSPCKNLHPQVLKDMMDDELYIVKDPETGEDLYKTKVSAESQVAIYVCSAISLPDIDHILQLIHIPVTHVIGTKARWNPPASAPAIRKNLGDNLMKAVDVDGGEHLLNGERPDETVSILVDHITSRVQAAIRNRAYVPDIRYNFDRKKIFEQQWEVLLKGDVAGSMTFEAPGKDEKL